MSAQVTGYFISFISVLYDVVCTNADVLTFMTDAGMCVDVRGTAYSNWA